MRGGFREGAGRPKAVPKVQVRVPEPLLPRIQRLISCYNNQTVEPAAQPWFPVSIMPDPGRRIDIWCVEDGKGWCCYEISSDMFIQDSQPRSRSYWVKKITAWRYSSLVEPPAF